MSEDYPTMIREEMTRRGLKPTSASIAKLADEAEREGIELGEIGVAMLVLGYAIGRGIPLK